MGLNLRQLFHNNYVQGLSLSIFICWCLCLSISISVSPCSLFSFFSFLFSIPSLYPSPPHSLSLFLSLSFYFFFSLSVLSFNLSSCLISRILSPSFSSLVHRDEGVSIVRCLLLSHTPSTSLYPSPPHSLSLSLSLSLCPLLQPLCLLNLPDPLPHLYLLWCIATRGYRKCDVCFSLTLQVPLGSEIIILFNSEVQCYQGASVLITPPLSFK